MANPYKTALLGKLGVEDEDQPEPMGMGAMGGAGGGPGMTSGKQPTLDQIAGPASPPPISASPSAPVASSPFQSQNATARGYLDEAVRAFAPTVKGIADEAGRKKAVEDYISSLRPEIEKRGGSLGDIRGEKARLDGRMLDFYRDIEGAADPQMLDVTDEGPAMGGGMGGLDASLTGDPTASIQEALARLGNSPNLQALLQQLGAA